MRSLKAAVVALALIGAVTLALSTAADPKSAADRNKALVARMLDESITGRNADKLDDYLSAEYVHHGTGGTETDRETHKAAAHAYLVAFADAKFELLDQIAEGDKVVTRWRFTGTHEGPLEGMPATGKSVALLGISIHRIEGDRVVEGWEASDTLVFLQQLGMLPAPQAQAYD